MSGRGDAAGNLSRATLLAWVNQFLQLKVSKVEQFANGAIFCQIIDACHPGAVQMKKVNWMARDEHQCIPNFKVLQLAFDKSGIRKHIEVDKVMKGKAQDNLEMLQWIKTHFDRTFPEGDVYDPVSRRAGVSVPDWARAPGSEDFAPPRRRESVGQQQRSSGSRCRSDAASTTSLAFDHERLQEEYHRLREEHGRIREENVDLKIMVDGLETERDWYFEKLKDIEKLVQTLNSREDGGISLPGFAQLVERILYAEDQLNDDFGSQRALSPAQ